MVISLYLASNMKSFIGYNSFEKNYNYKLTSGESFPSGIISKPLVIDDNEYANDANNSEKIISISAGGILLLFYLMFL